jgi:choline-sulfatase
VGRCHRADAVEVPGTVSLSLPSLARRSLSLLTTIALAGCGSNRTPARHLVLVTIDTLRADRLGCYGSKDVETPNLDRISREGAIALHAAAHVPLTRPSHTSLMTGMLPTRHGVRDNITPSPLRDVPTLATVMKSAGFATGAFVSTIVLASGGGLERGFDVYSDDFHEAETRSGSDAESSPFLNTLQRRGDETLDEALAWIASRQDERIFAWIHLYDPHDPYEPPEPYRSRYPGRPYDGEVAWSDELIGRLDAGLARLSMRENTLLVVTSDHGEGLGDHGETLHGFFIYESTLRIPLILRGPGVAPGTRLTSLVGSVDLFPTLVAMMGLESGPSAGRTGESFASALGGGLDPPEHVHYAETLVPLLHFGWSDLRAVRKGRWKYVQAPRPELYDLSEDPTERENLASSEPAIVRGMSAALGEELAAERAAGATDSSTASVPQELLDKLGALGYVGSASHAASTTPGADPKDKIEEFRVANDLIREGLVLYEQRDYAGSVDRYRKLLQLSIESFEVHFYLARGLAALGRSREAAVHFEEATRREPLHAGAWEGLSEALSEQGNLEGALAAVRDAVRALPDDAALRQREGAILVKMRRPEEARKAYEAAVSLAPRNALLHARLGELLRQLGAVEESIARLREATEIDPGTASYWNSLGMTLGGNGRLAEAETAFRQAVSLDETSARYVFNLGLLLLREGKPRDARAFFERTIAIDPGFDEARRYLASTESR